MADRKQITIENILFYNMKTIISSNGVLVPIESDYDLPFPIKRIFYVYGVKNKEVRGQHAHYKTKQFLICLNGKIEVICKDGINSKRFLLESPQQGLLIPEMIWDEQIYRSENAILLVLSNLKYDSNDYIHDYKEFKKLKGIKT